LENYGSIIDVCVLSETLFAAGVVVQHNGGKAISSAVGGAGVIVAVGFAVSSIPSALMLFSDPFLYHSPCAISGLCGNILPSIQSNICS
jgi:hypothetical protein